MKLINIEKEEFESIFLDIKERYLSKNNFPKLIVGTGLSIAMGVPGMSKLAERLEEKFENIEDLNLREKWNKYSTKIKKEGLEDALLDISTSEELFVEKIREITSEFILIEEYKQQPMILNTVSGFEKLLKYLSETVSVNNKIIDIMTPNYDRIIELICDKLKLPTTLGFSGNIYQTFNVNILKRPREYFSKDNILVRIFKPHGSVNWIKMSGKEYQVNDYHLLKNKKEDIDIIPPGAMKYKSGMINDIFRQHRESFNELISDLNSYSILIYGYGFNDQHFNTVFQNTTKDVLVLTKVIKSSFLKKVTQNKNWTFFYKCEDGNENTSTESYMIYKGKKYKVNKDLWDINIFSETFFNVGE